MTRPSIIILPLIATTGAMAAFQIGAALAKGLFPAVGPEGAVTLRLCLGAVMLLAVARPWRSWPVNASVAPLIGLGIAMAGAILLFYMAIQRLPLGIAIALQFLGPLAVALLGSRRPADLLWALLAAAGVWCLVGMLPNSTPLDPTGIVCALGAACGWAAYILLGREAGSMFGASTAALAVSIGALLSVPLGVAHAGSALFSPALLPLAMMVALLSAAIPFSLELYALPRLPARTFAIFTSLEPVFAVLSGLLLLGEVLTPLQIGGIVATVTAAAGAAWSSASKAD